MLTDGLNDFMFEWLACQQIDWMVGSLIDQKIDVFFDELIEWLIDWLMD